MVSFNMLPKFIILACWLHLFYPVSTLNLTFGISEQSAKKQMLKLKILLMVILFVILGVIAYFNFGFHHILTERSGEKSILNQPAWEELEENIKNNQTEILQEFQDPSADQ